MRADNSAFAALQARFLTGLAVRVSTLRASLDIARNTDGNGLAADSVLRQFHSLAGIGGTYGFHHVTHLARAAELVCTSAAGASRPLSDAECALLDSVVDALEQASQCAEHFAPVVTGGPRSEEHPVNSAVIAGRASG